MQKGRAQNGGRGAVARLHELAHKAGEKSDSLKEKLADASNTVRNAAAGLSDQAEQTIKKATEKKSDEQ